MYNDRLVKAPRTLTCGLQNSDSPQLDNLTPQETTSQASGTVGADRTGLSCPGSSGVAESKEEEEEEEEHNET